MPMKPTYVPMLIIMAGSTLLLLGAYGFEFIGGLQPCKLCYWQRFGHLAIILAALLCALFARRVFYALGLMVSLANVALALYHVGVENKWWQGPKSCSSARELGEISVDELFLQLQATSMVRCDEIPWSFLSISMAGWNGIITLILAFFWLKAIQKTF